MVATTHGSVELFRAPLGHYLYVTQLGWDTDMARVQAIMRNTVIGTTSLGAGGEDTALKRRGKRLAYSSKEAIDTMWACELALVS